ncbi:unnamed protein product [Rotaria magnacalcarata]|uniref:HTH psq-type domain-containing protein n=1 Tax=Rotaria magnacalcarata TaxID=392030 RepID=A0A815X0K4_9BILA|nr:unnamed protein product [Rotaria magnacalcarata]
MAPAYKRKTQDKYSKDDLEQALSDIQNKRLSIKTAVAHYHIPTRTIFHRLAGSRTGTGSGGKKNLTKEEEFHLVTTIILFQKWQCPISSSVVIGLAKPYVIQLRKPISELWKNHVLKGHCSGDFAKAGIYPYDPRAVSKEKLLGPSSSNDESTSVDDSAVIHQPVNRLTQSASCE